MKKIIYLTTFLITSVSLGQNENYYNTTSGNGYGFRLWNGNDAYKIHMGNAAEYIYGPVTDYSIKTNMSNNATRGWTWGVAGVTPIAALNTLGNFQIAGNFVSMGNMGIGTATPSGKLEIYGSNFNSTNLILSANYPNSYRWRFKTIDRGNAIDLDFTASDSNDSEETILKLSRSNSTRPEFQLYNNAIVANNGNVGIGNASPAEKLHVSGNILSNKMLLNDPNDTSDWSTIWQSGFFQSYDAVNVPESGVWFWGINMNHSSNNSDYKYSGQLIIKNSTTIPTMYFRSTDRNGVGTWAKIIHNVGNQKIDGTLAIGTPSTGNHKLAVEGSIGAREIKVQATGWSDFVFEDSYQLPTLEEVEQHIKEKGHLKDIPSAKYVEKNGIYLGDMNAKLLQKIEELTLYTIEQEKQLKEQKNEQENQQKKITEQDKKIIELENKINQLLNTIEK